MVYPQEIKKAHEEIQKKLFLMLPEKWDSLYLYASVIDHMNKLQTGEMFFYYYPKGVLKKRPINVYEVPSKFNLDENQYYKLADDLYSSVKELREICINNHEKPWSSVTIAIEGIKYRAIYEYDDLISKEFDSNERRVIWTYKYLHTPYESLNKKERNAVDRYQRMVKPRATEYEQPIYEKERNKKLDTVKSLEKNLEFVTEEKIEEMKYKNTHVPKSQILLTK